MHPKLTPSFRQSCLGFSLVVLTSGMTAESLRARTIDSTLVPNPITSIPPTAPTLPAFLPSLGSEISPTVAYVPVENSIVQGVPNAPELIQQGRKLYEAGQFSAAAKVLQQVVQNRTPGDVIIKALALSYLSLAYQQLEQWPQATKAIATSLKLLQPGDSRTSNQRTLILAQALNTQGRLQLALGQSETALATWQQAAATYTQAGDAAGSIGSLINQAQALQALGLYRRASTTLTQAQQALQQQPVSLLKVTGLLSLGNTLRVVGKLDDSRQALQQSLTVAQRLQSPQAIGDTLLSLGNTARAQQDAQAALVFYQQAATASNSSTTQLQAQLNQLNLLLETQQWWIAQTLWPQIQAQLTNLPPSRTAIYARINFAQSLIKLGTKGSRLTASKAEGTGNGELKNSAAVVPSSASIAQLMATAVQQAKSLGDQRAEAHALGNLGGLYEQTQQWSSAQDLTQQALLLAQAINAPDIAYRWQWQLGRLLREQKNPQGAIAAYTEAVKTLQSLRSDLVAVNSDVQYSFRESVEPVYRQLVDLLLQSEVAAPSQQQNLLIQARVVVESLQLAELDNFFRVACLEAKPILIDQVIDQDDPTAAVIYPIILGNRVEIILKLPQQPLRHYTTFIDEQQVESVLDRLGQSLTQRNSQETLPLSQEVYKWLIRSAEADLVKSRVKTLVFVLDGPLRNIPMAALHDGQQYLVEKYGVALTPGLQLLAPQPLKREQLKALTAGLSEARGDFPSLKFVPRELDQVRSQIPSVELLNQEFTSTAFQSKINSLPFPVVHLATHGQFSSQPEKTFILTWDDSIDVNELNNLLRTNGQSRVGNIELLVLSACETVTGDRRAALGLAGVAVRAGARSTLATLWRVNDEATAFLMGEFYQELANTTVTKAEVVRRAQLALLRNPRFKRPHFWAPYVLVGNWL